MKPQKNLLAAHRMLGLYGALKPTEHETTMRQIAVLAFVTVNPGMSVCDAAVALKMSRPAVTRSIDALASRGMAKRQRQKGDKRLVSLNATGTGEAFLQRLSGAVA